MSVNSIKNWTKLFNSNNSCLKINSLTKTGTICNNVIYKMQGKLFYFYFSTFSNDRPDKEWEGNDRMVKILHLHSLESIGYVNLNFVTDATSYIVKSGTTMHIFLLIKSSIGRQEDRVNFPPRWCQCDKEKFWLVSSS